MCIVAQPSFSIIHLFHEGSGKGGGGGQVFFADFWQFPPFLFFLGWLLAEPRGFVVRMKQINGIFLQSRLQKIYWYHGISQISPPLEILYISQ